VAVHAGARRLRRAYALAALGLACGLAASAAHAGAGALVFSPEQTRVEFTLGATLHEVHGTLKLVRGELSFDPAGGAASGTIVLDARSAQTGNERRDRTMHGDVLESEKYPEIEFRAERLELTRQAADRAEAVLHGHVRIHGGEHALAIPAHVEREADRSIRVRAEFPVPYVAWGMRDVSNFVLHVEPQVTVRVDATATLRDGE
jgi:polyisoprenoid-binding protein YceI